MAQKRSKGRVDISADTQSNLFESPRLTNQQTSCLGKDFETEDFRRAYFLDQLRDKLKDPSYRALSGFPTGADEAILRLSDPPFYTACPNPFLEELVLFYGQRFDPSDLYEREPLAIDISVGRSDALYKAHGYHTKIPHLAIVSSILHYTEPGDIVLDGFCGSGMTGLAAQWCSTAPENYRRTVESDWAIQGRRKPQWGLRHAILSDLSPAATFIAAGYNLPFDVKSFEREASRILTNIETEFGWMYETLHHDGTLGRINYTVWSEVFSCPSCSEEVSFFEQALNQETGRVRDNFSCPSCLVTLTKKQLKKVYISRNDVAIGEIIQSPKRIPVLINYDTVGGTFEKRPDPADLALIERVQGLPLPPELPCNKLPYMHMTHERARLDQAGITHVHHFFLPRAAHSLSALWKHAQGYDDTRMRNALLFFAEQAIWGMSVLARYTPTHFSQVNQYLNGVYYIGSQIVEVSPWYILNGKLNRLVKSFSPLPNVAAGAAVSTNDCGTFLLPDNCIDYVFTDPPFGGNIFYSDLNYLIESWHRVFTEASPEAVVDPPKRKGVDEYQELMHHCFKEYYRVLKPNRWMTVVFSNSSVEIWQALQEAIGTAGFAIQHVHTLDKQQGSYRQVTSSAVKQDLVISAYKPRTQASKPFRLKKSSVEEAWNFVEQRLHDAPVLNEQAEVIAERTAQMLLDRMISFHVKNGLAVPISGTEFLSGLSQRFIERDGMYFLPAQVELYDQKRRLLKETGQLDLLDSRK